MKATVGTSTAELAGSRPSPSHSTRPQAHCGSIPVTCALLLPARQLGRMALAREDRVRGDLNPYPNP